MQLLEELSTSPLGLYAPLLGVRIFGLGLCQLLVAYRDPRSSVPAKLSKLLVRSNQEEERVGGEGTRGDKRGRIRWRAASDSFVFSTSWPLVL
jgi:hypothetical protein